jgi:hypothetical protein
MYKLNSNALLLLIGLCVGFGCTYNSREPAIVPNAVQTCDTTQKYTYASVDPLFENYSCKSCHNVGNNLPNIEDSTTFRAYIKINKEKFLQAINYAGAHPMPKDLGKMPMADIRKIEAWICQGMK